MLHEHQVMGFGCLVCGLHLKKQKTDVRSVQGIVSYIELIVLLWVFYQVNLYVPWRQGNTGFPSMDSLTSPRTEQRRKILRHTLSRLVRNVLRWVVVKLEGGEEGGKTR